MSRNRSRNIQKKIIHEDFSENISAKWFGDYILNGASFSGIEDVNNAASYSEIDTVDNLSVSKSSSSSLSWGEDCEAEATQRVKYEYDRMNNVLQGLEPIPPHYDKDEYKLWIKTFPCLRSTHIETSKKTTKSTIKCNCDNVQDDLLNDTVIDSLLNKMCFKLTTTSNDTKTLDRRKKSENRQVHVKNQINTCKATLQDDFSSLLRISPAPTYEKPSMLEKRRRSTHYVEEINSSDLHSREYASLPHLPPSDNNCSNTKHKNSNTLKGKNRKRHYTNKIILPPIDVSLNQFRSISAIPLQQNKCFSALSTKTNFAVGCNNSNSTVCNSSVNTRRLNGFY